jgi:hypothetical protein
MALRYLGKTHIVALVALEELSEDMGDGTFDARRIYMTVFAIGTALAMVAGVLAAPLYSVYPNMGDGFLIISFVAHLSEEPADARVRSAVTRRMNPRRRSSQMLKRTLAGLAFLLAVTALNSSPASAFGWCGWGWGYGASPRAYSYAPRTYYRPRARFYRPAYYGRAYYRPGVRVYRRAYYGRPFVGRAYRPVARGFYRSGVRVSGPRTRAFYRPGVQRAFGTGDLARHRGRLP